VAPWLFWGCASFVPLRDPPGLEAGDPLAGAQTRADVLARLGPPLEVRGTDAGEVLVYRRVVVSNVNPTRYYGESGEIVYDRYDRLLIVIDPNGRLVTWTTESE
jgi:hypothetical protein